MQISKKCEYALRAMYELAKDKTNTPISVSKIAERQCIPYKFLEQIFSILRKHNLVKGVSGKNGGYILYSPANQITIAEILKAAEGNLNIISCLQGDETCQFFHNCDFKNFWTKFNAHIIEFLNFFTLEDIIKGV
ncbi:MAG: hypothetical protein DRH57_02935 [Candidatus Cloacimonadota bacterium]|nr:MAG: hypothetical protein DRH57_02935 [Candidatus Cloacimonadota bacterium]